jgi:hypothetical protein
MNEKEKKGKNLTWLGVIIVLSFSGVVGSE